MGLIDIFKSKKADEVSTETVKTTYEIFESYPLEKLIEYFIKKEKYKDDKKKFVAIIGQAFPKGGVNFIAKAYLYNLFFTNKECGGLGLSKENEEIICNSKLFNRWASDLDIYGDRELYKIPNSFAKNGGMIKNKKYELLNILEEKVLLDKIDTYLIMLTYLKGSDYSIDGEKSRLAVVECFCDRNSFVFDERMLVGDPETIETRFKFCYQIVNKPEVLEVLKMFKRDENGEKMDEYITFEDVLPLKTETEITEFFQYTVDPKSLEILKRM